MIRSAKSKAAIEYLVEIAFNIKLGEKGEVVSVAGRAVVVMACTHVIKH